MDDLRNIDEDSFYKSVLPRLKELEIIRQAKLKIYLWRRKIGIAGATILTPPCVFLDWLLLRWQAGNDDSAAGLTAMVLGALYWWVTQPKRQYAKAYKQDILPRIAHLFGALTYEAEGKMPMEVLKESKIIAQHHRYASEDYFSGLYKGIRITLSEIHLERRQRSGKRTHYVTVFKGLAVLIAMPREKFHGHTLLLENANRLAQWFTEKNHQLDRADLVDPEFEKAFDVYTSDQVEARYLIDPTMIESLKKMRDTYDAKNFSAAYFKNQALVLLPSQKNYFEPASIYTPATDPASIISMKQELGQVLDLVDRLEIYDAVSLYREKAAPVASVG